MTCRTCEFWGNMTELLGSCSALSGEVPEGVTHWIVYEREESCMYSQVADKNSHSVEILTPDDFHCAMYQQKVSQN